MDGRSASGQTAVPSIPARQARWKAIAIIAAARLGLMLGVGAVAVGEMFAARKGVGYLLMTFTANFDTAGVMATLTVILGPTILAGMLLTGVEDQLAA